MKCLTAFTLSVLLAAGYAANAGAQQKKDLQLKEAGSGAAAAAERGVAIAATPACALARSVTEQLGRLAPQVKPLPNAQAFGAANGAVKLVVACGMSADETYTYNRLLSNLGIGLLPFRGDEPPQKVVQELADRLKLSYQRPASATLPLTYLFPGQGSDNKGVRLTVQAAGSAAAAAAIKAPPAQPKSENLLDLYLLARAGDPDLGRSQSRFLISRADTDVARAGLRPRVNADFGVSWIDQSTYNDGFDTLNSTVFGYNYDFLARVPVLHIPAHYNLAASKAVERSEEAGVAAARQRLMTKLVQAYFGVLKTRGDERIAREEISRVRQALEQAQAFLKAGTGDVIAVYEAQARLDSVIADLNRNENGLTLAEQRLSSIVGKVVADIADYPKRQPRAPEPDDLEWWLKTMEEKEPLIRQAQEVLAGSELQAKSAKAGHLPVIDANGSFNVSKGAAYAPEVETRQWRVGATITLPLYSGGETSARTRRAAASETEKRYALDQVREQRRENVKQAFFNLRYNVSLIKALEQKEESALVKLNAIKKGRSIGTRTAIDLLNAEQDYSVAQRDLKNALYDNVVRLIELKASAGILSEEEIALD